MSICVSIIIANYNGAHYLRKCIDSILKDKSKRYEIIVVDDNSQDNSLQILARYNKKQNVTIIKLANSSGATKARNIGAKKARGLYLFFLDYDTTIQSEWVDPLCDYFHKHPKIGAAQTKLLRWGTRYYDYAGDYLSALGFLVERSHGKCDRGQFDEISPIFSMKGAAMIVRKDVFNKVRGFDEDFEYLWEEPDLTWRIWLLGYRVVFFPFITVQHAYVSNVKNEEYYKRISVTFRGCRNNILTLLKNYEIKNCLLVIPLHTAAWIILVILFIMRGKYSRAWSIMRGINWNIQHLRDTLKKRQKIQRKRILSDTQLFSVVGTHNSPLYYLLKAKSYVTGKPY